MDRGVLLRAREDRVEATALLLEGEFGPQTAYTRHRDGRVTGGMKYHEGRLVSYRAVAAVLRGAPQRPAADVLSEHIEHWRAEFDRHAGRGATQWAAYATGGLDAAAEACCLADAPCGSR
jgi:hypothetical protein